MLPQEAVHARRMYTQLANDSYLIFDCVRHVLAVIVEVVWATGGLLFFNYWSCQHAITIPPPFQFNYYTSLLHHATDKLELVLPAIDTPKHTLDLCILTKDDVYFLPTAHYRRHIPRLAPSPAVLCRYWNPKTRSIMAVLLHHAYQKRAFLSDHKSCLKRIRWTQLNTSVFGSTISPRDLHFLPNTPIDSRLISLLKEAPPWNRLFTSPEQCLASGCLPDGPFDCCGVAHWLQGAKAKDDVSVSDKLGNLYLDFDRPPVPTRNWLVSPATSLNMLGIGSGDMFYLDRVVHDYYKPAEGNLGLFQLNWLKWSRAFVADREVHHYATHLFGDWHISKCGAGGGLYIATFEQTMAFYRMDYARLQIYNSKNTKDEIEPPVGETIIVKYGA